MYSSPGPYQSNQNNIDAGASSSTSSSNIVVRPNPSPPMTPQRQTTASIPTAPLGRGRNRKQTELQQLNNEIQLLQAELNSLNNIPPASKACKDLVTFVENRSDPFFPNSEGLEPQSWPNDRPVKARRPWWKF